MKQYLTDWTLCGYHNYVPVMEKSMETNTELCGVIPFIPAKVPCSVYEPLLESGIIPDPYFDVNSRQCEWVASRFWVFKTEFSAPAPRPGGRYRLVFEGLDCKCEIWLNGKKIAESDNMYVPVRTDVTELLRCGEANRLKVMFFNAPDEMGQIGYTSRVRTQKARYSYKWDFCPRLPSIGIYRPVYLEEYFAEAEDFDIRTDMYGNFSLSFRYACPAGACARIRLSDGGTAVYSAEFSLAESGVFSHSAALENPKLWNCNTCGEANLYGLEIEFVQGGRALLCRRFEVGFKTLEVLPNEGAPAGAPPYLFVLNGRKTYIKGANLAPFDIEKVRKVLSDVKAMNANLVRVWGGGFIESEYFYSLCDRMGLLVWQDFIQSSSGIDNHPSHSKKFVGKFMETVRCAVSEKRNHPCTAVFCGGNEIARGPKRTPIDESDLLIGKVGEYVRTHSAVHFVATTPCGANFSPDFGHPETNHDVHAPWVYLGDVEQYKFGNRLQCLFYSEFGANGMSDLSSFGKFLSPENIGIFDCKSNAVWRHHGEMWDTYFRDRAIFGDTVRSLSDMVAVSQFIQAEAIRYLIESNRRRAFANGGVMFWCFNEPFPNVSNTSLTDYYGNKKYAYRAVSRCYQNAYASIVYDKLVWNRGERLVVRPYVISCGGEFTLEITATCGGEVLALQRFTGCAEKDRTACFGEISFDVPEGKGIEFNFALCSGGKAYHNRVLLLIAEDGHADASEVIRFLKEDA